MSTLSKIDQSVKPLVTLQDVIDANEVIVAQLKTVKRQLEFVEVQNGDHQAAAIAAIDFQLGKAADIIVLVNNWILEGTDETS